MVLAGLYWICYWSTLREMANCVGWMICFGPLEWRWEVIIVVMGDVSEGGFCSGYFGKR